MNELEKLRPEVQRAFIRADRWKRGDRSWEIIRAELLRLAGECAMIPRAQLLANFAAANERAEKAEAELATAQNAIDAQQDTMGALKRKLAIAEAELAALKARIAEAKHVDVTLGCAIDGEIPPDLALCKVALVKVKE